MSFRDHQERLDLYRQRDELIEQQPSAQREIDIARTGLRIEFIEGVMQKEVADMTRLLFDSYLRAGSMSIVLRDDQRIGGLPHKTGNEIHDIRNVRAEAARLAEIWYMRP